MIVARQMRLFRSRLGDERGSVGILMAMFAFVVVGMLMMTWNTAQLSKEKMRLQNAADAAALSHAVWQARGMNSIQNLNDEMYAALAAGTQFSYIFLGVEGAAQALDSLRTVLIVGLIAGPIATVLHTVSMMLMSMSGFLIHNVVENMLCSLGGFYIYCSGGLGYWKAQLLAEKNLADPLPGGASLSGWGGAGFYAAGASTEPKDLVRLPIVEKASSKWLIFSLGEPWTVSVFHWGALTTMLHLMSIRIWSIPYYKVIMAVGFDCGSRWSVDPLVSEGYKGDVNATDIKTMGRLPKPSVWVAWKRAGHIETLNFDLWKAQKGSRPGANDDMVAIAAAQCVSGDVVPRSKRAAGGKDVQNRTAGFGTGATAKLVPVATALNEAERGMGIIFH